MQFLEQFKNFYQSLNQWQDLLFDFLVLAPILGLIFIFSSKIGLFMVKKIFSIDLDYKLFNSKVANYFLLILIGFVLSIIVGLAP
jgi:hypothetical protein|tara:strand:- start:96 stop:350 length:255 start_codon:yes stop_codon:yes gene_type:complete